MTTQTPFAAPAKETLDVTRYMRVRQAAAAFAQAMVAASPSMALADIGETFRMGVSAAAVELAVAQHRAAAAAPVEEP